MYRTNFMRFGISVSIVLSSLSLISFAGDNVAFAASSVSSSTTSNGRPAPIFHTISTGDTLWSLSTAHRISVSSLERWNAMTDQTILQLGQKVIVGWSTSYAAEQVPRSRKSTYHTVVAGNTLWSIAAAHQVPVQKLEAWNDLTDSSTLEIRQKIIIRRSSRISASSASAQTSLTSQNGASDTNAGDGGLGQEFVAYAERFLGVPYLWGGESPTTGFDCSGLVQYTLRNFGVTIARTSYDQYLAGTPVARSDLQPGDLVFFDTDGPGASHDGIYAGNGTFVNSANGGVQIDSMSSGYWSEYYIGARRVR